MKLRTKLLLVLIALFGLYLLAGFFIAPWVVRSQMLKHLPEVLDRPVTLETVRFNPLKLALELENFAIQEPDGSPFVSLGGLLVDLQASSLVRSGFSFKEIRLTEPNLRVLRDDDGGLNFNDLLEAKEPTEPDPEADAEGEEIPIIRIGRLVVEGGGFSLEDRSPLSHYRKEFGNISFTAEDLRTDPDQVGSFNISGQSKEAETVRLTGQISLNPVNIQGVFIMEALDLPHFMPYVENLVDGKLEDGLLSVRMAYDIQPGGSNPALLIYDAFAELDQLVVLTHDATDPVIAWDRFAISNASIDLLEETVDIDEITLAGGNVLAHRHKDGRINLMTAWLGVDKEPVAESSAPAEVDDPASSFNWIAKVDRIGITDTELAFLDDTLPEPARISVRVEETELTGFSTEAESPYKLRISLANDAGGSSTLEGDGKLFPVSGSYTLSMEQWKLTPLDPFLSAFTGIELQEGALDVAGQMSFREGQDGFTGDLSFELVQLLNPKLQLVLPEKPDAMVDADEPEPAEEAEEAEEVAVAEEAGEGPSPEESSEAEPVETSAPPPFAIAVKTFSLVDGAFAFKDMDQDPDVVFSITEIDSTIEGLSTDPAVRPAFTLQAQLMDITPLSASGELNLLASHPYADVQVDLKGLGMTPFGPYFSRYVGYNLEKGLLNLDLHYMLEDEELDASNVVILNQLTLGEKTDSPDATGLPVPLAISLLKDPAGDIEVDLPIQGRLDDPKFRIGRVVMRALSTLIVKAASSPFNLLAGLVDVSADDLEKTAFAAGSSELAAASMTQLDALATAMEKRPGIRLELTAGIDPSVETPALKKRVLEENILAEVELDNEADLSEGEAYQARLAKAYRSRKTLAFLAGGLPSVPEMEAFIMDRIDIGQDDLVQLAAARKQAVRNYLVKKDGIDPERVLIQSDASLELTETGSSVVRLSIQ